VVKINFLGGKNQFFFPCDTRTLPCWLRKVLKINFPGSPARQTNFTANANQSNGSVTVVKMNFHCGKNQFPRW